VITHDTLLAVAAEGERGRSLFVGVTNLDDGYGYAIDLTALAETAKRTNSIDSARQCYIDALIASSSVPPGVPPVSLKINGHSESNLYMDGGARFGVFFDQMQHIPSLQSADMTLVVNGVLYGDSWTEKSKPVKKWSVLNFALRAVDLMENQVYRFSVADAERWGSANGTLQMAYISSEGLKHMKVDPDGWDYKGETCAKASSIDDLESPKQFHPRYMRCLIDYGQKRGAQDPWNKIISGSAPGR